MGMSNSYDYHQERATCLFVRHRAHVALDDALLRHYPARKSYLWICREDDDIFRDSAGDLALRTRIAESLQKVESRVDKLDSRVEEVVGAVQKCLKNIAVLMQRASEERRSASS